MDLIWPSFCCQNICWWQGGAENKIIAWGTGENAREFLHVRDAAEGIVLAAERYIKPDPVNLGAGEEIKVRNLVHLIKELPGFGGKVEGDAFEPYAQPRGRLDTSQAKEEFGFEAKLDLPEELMPTIERYKNPKEIISDVRSLG